MVHFQVCDSGSCISVQGATPVNDCGWQYLAATLSHTKGSPAFLNVYVNGELDGSSGPHTLWSIDSSSDLRIGAGPSFGSPTDFFYGQIDELEIFERTLSPEEIFMIYAAGTSGKCKDRCKATREANCTSPGTANAWIGICNSSGIPQDFSWSVVPSGVGGSCNVPGPTAYTPSSGAVNSQIGCTSIPVSIGCNSGLTAGDQGCFDLEVVNLSAVNQSVACQGSIYVVNKLIISGAVAELTVSTGEATATAFELTNTDSSDALIEYELQVRDSATNLVTNAVSIDGLQPGVAASGLVLVPSDQTVTLSAKLQFLVPRPFRSYDLLFVVNGEPISSVAVRFHENQQSVPSGKNMTFVMMALSLLTVGAISIASSKRKAR
jgi:hypothetical protein